MRANAIKMQMSKALTKVRKIALLNTFDHDFFYINKNIKQKDLIDTDFSDDPKRLRSSIH